MLVSEDNIDMEVDKIFNYYREVGFPNYSKDNYDIKKELNKLIKFDESTILYSGNCLKQTMHSCGFLWTYFPHWVEIECGSSKSIMDSWNDDTTLKKLIKKTLKWNIKHNKGKWTTNRIRQNSKVYGAKQSVSNFRPTVAKYIYNTYGNEGNVWDMCSGFGGRLLGFLSSNCKSYTGTDPATLTYNGLVELKNDYNYVEKNVRLINSGCEEVRLPDNSMDLCFTSPPYFDTEKYSTEETQSYIKFPTVDQWTNGFLTDLIQNSYNCLKPGGYLVLNIANTKSADDLESKTLQIANNTKFKYENTLNLVLSSIAGKGVKFEPIFIFRK